jgi:1-acyl-sn-glycerol-3-phosphate acyltransferase
MWRRLKFGLMRTAIVILLRLMTHTEVVGIEKLNGLKGKAIVASNHLGTLDAGYAFMLVKRSDLIMVVAEKYREHPVFSRLVKQLNLLFIDRHEADFGTLRETLRRLDRGGILFLAPEGTRSRTEALLEGKPGVAYLAAKSQATVVPAAVTGTEDRVVGEKLRRFQRPHVRLVIGEPFTIPPLPKQDRDVFLRQQTDEIMTRIAVLLPEKYRGVYAQHPRLRKLIALRS